MKSTFSLCVVLCLIASSLAQTTSTNATRKPGKASAGGSKEVQQLKDALETQQKQIEEQRQLMQRLTDEMQRRDAEMQKRDAALEQAQEQIKKLQSVTDAQGNQQQAVSDLKNDVTDLKQNTTNMALSLQETQKNITSSLESPIAIHYKGVTLTPGGFFAAETVRRSAALGADINTPFNSVPMPGATADRLSEFFGSGRQSRISLLTEGKLGNAKLTGYLEADFLAAAVTSNNNQSNSYGLRQRQVWAQAAWNGWAFTGGQMWSLITETRLGMDNRTEALPMTIDPQYTAGFSWARQYGFRVTKRANDWLSLGAAIEDSQATLGGHLLSGQNNFILGSQGNGAGLYNATANYSFNPSPDFVFKGTFEPKGHGHYELFGMIHDFRDRVFPCGGNIVASNGVLPPTVPCGTGNIPNASTAYNSSKVGGGIGVNARITVEKKLDLGVHFLGGNGVGRYGTVGLADVVARPDGQLAPVRNYQALSTVEYHTAKLDIYANVGGEYENRTAYVVGGKGSGYGSTLFNNSGCMIEGAPASTIINVDTPVSSTSGNTVNSGTVTSPGAVGTPLSPGFNPANPANCTGDTRVLLEGTIGFWYRFYSGPKGRLQWGPQFSYIDRNTWSGIAANPQGLITPPLTNPNATEKMFLTSFRYYLP